MNVGEPAILPVPLVIRAVSLPLLTMLRPARSTLFPYTTLFRSLVAVGGLIRIAASTHVLPAGLLLPAVPSVVRVTEPASVSGMEEVAETKMGRAHVWTPVTDQLRVAPPAG